MFLVLLPTVVTLVEIVGLVLYIRDFKSQHYSKTFFGMFVLSLVPTTWLQITLGKWMLWVRKYVRLREQRVR